mmetsp:Transcript_23862/g.35688  ORF Transcript_23862/g.35688 Transcript_23862/m.35688 type:complete len:87 (-) Transcript_23862:666-926(-)
MHQRLNISRNADGRKGTRASAETATARQHAIKQTPTDQRTMPQQHQTASSSQLQLAAEAVAGKASPEKRNPAHVRGNGCTSTPLLS